MQTPPQRPLPAAATTEFLVRRGLFVGLRDVGRGPGLVTCRNLGSLQTGPGTDLRCWRESQHLEEGRLPEEDMVGLSLYG